MTGMVGMWNLTVDANLEHTEQTKEMVMPSWKVPITPLVVQFQTRLAVQQCNSTTLREQTGQNNGQI